MKERPIIFFGPMVRAILDGRKTQTRRVVKPQPTGEPRPLREWSERLAATCGDYRPDADKIALHADRLRGRIFPFTNEHGGLTSPRCPYGQPGDRLWVREAWRAEERESDMVDGVRFRSDDAFVPIENTRGAADAWCEAHDNGRHGSRWRPSIFMPRWASRLSLVVEDVRVERLQEITEADALAEGVPNGPGVLNPLRAFANGWDSINGKRHGASWDDNPWVWAVTFRRKDGR